MYSGKKDEEFDSSLCDGNVTAWVVDQTTEKEPESYIWTATKERHQEYQRKFGITPEEADFIFVLPSTTYSLRNTKSGRLIGTVVFDEGNLDRIILTSEKGLPAVVEFLENRGEFLTSDVLSRSKIGSQQGVTMPNLAALMKQSKLTGQSGKRTSRQQIFPS